MWPDQPLSYVILPDDDHGMHFGLFLNARLISVASIFITENQAQLRKFATKREYQQKGYGTALLQYIIDQITKKGTEKIWCNARKMKSNFYENFGFTYTDKEFQKGKIPYVIMEKRL